MCLYVSPASSYLDPDKDWLHCCRELVQVTSRDKQLYQVQFEEAERRAKAAEAQVQQLQSNVDTLKIMLQEEQARPSRNDQACCPAPSIAGANDGPGH